MRRRRRDARTGFPTGVRTGASTTADGPTTARGDVAAPSPRADGISARTRAAVVSGALAVLGVCGLALLPVPYVIERPGPVRDTLAADGGVERIAVEGTETYPTEGSLDLTTVNISGGPGGAVDLVQLARAALDGSQSVLPFDLLYSPTTTEAEEEQRDAQDMTDSQDSATVAALTELGTDVPSTIEVAAVPDGSAAATALRPGDRLLAVRGDDVTTLAALRSVLDGVTAGDPVDATVLRAGAPVDVEVTTTAGDAGQAQLGISASTSYDLDALPFSITIQIDEIGGPSAGMMFALGIIDKLTPGALTGGASVAGTGTISPDGQVGAIGGIRLKMIGAAEAGATAFLAPSANCDEVLGHEPDGLAVVSVSTLAEARDAVVAIGEGRADELPTCQAPQEGP